MVERACEEEAVVAKDSGETVGETNGERGGEGMVVRDAWVCCSAGAGEGESRRLRGEEREEREEEADEV